MDEFDAYWPRWLQHWHDLCDPEGPPWEDEYCAAGMINDLWNDRQRLAACMAPLPRAEALTARLNEIIDAALGGVPENTGLYFVVRDPYPASDDELTGWTTAFYRRCRELTGEPKAEPVIQIVRCDDPTGAFLLTWKDGDNHPHEALDEWVSDLLSDRCTVKERAAYYVLSEALYKMACNWMLSDFVQWALVEDKVQGPDPYRPQFDLWRSGASELYHPGRPVRVFAPAAGRVAGRGRSEQARS